MIALAVMAIQRNFRVPDGIMACYPAVNCCNYDYWPSLLLSLDDLVLAAQYLNVSVCSYSPKGKLYDADVQRCEYLSPALYTKDEVLAQFPKTIFTVGSLDPFKDDIYRFMDRLLQAGAKDVTIKEFRMFSHGFLSHDLEGEAIDETSDKQSERSKIV